MSTSPTKTDSSKGLAFKIVGAIFLVIGIIFAIIGFSFSKSANDFVSVSEPAQLRVTSVERRKSDNGYTYRPHFEARRDDGNVVQYVGNIWVSPKPHNEGDIVPGRVIWETGEIRSTGMMEFTGLLGKIFGWIGSGLAIFAAILLVVGFLRARRRVEVI